MRKYIKFPYAKNERIFAPVLCQGYTFKDTKYIIISDLLYFCIKLETKYNVTYLEFHKRWHELGCFNIQQVYAWRPDFNRLNLRFWEKKGYIVKLRKEYYAFAESKSIPDFTRYVANRIYRPSYISLHTALAYYGMIPEAVVQITSVTTLKTIRFANDFGEYAYHSVKPEMMFGYAPKPMADGRTFLFATPEKALLDLLYLHPFYKTETDMLDLRLDEDYMAEDFNFKLFTDYTERLGSLALTQRAKKLIKAYAS